MEILSNTASPIHRLNADLFAYIFNMSTNIFNEDGAFTTSRATSQVCRSWRELMLSSPSLWGKLLDFDAIGEEKAEAFWVDELIQRSGKVSALWIKANRVLGIEDPPRPQVQELFIKVLSENWHRIQALVVNLRWSNFAIRRVFCDTVSLPAPALVSFDFTAGVSTDEIPYRAAPGDFDDPLFANKAPCLRKFKATLHEFDLRAPWIHCLSDLYIDHSFLLSDILDALATTVNLQFLEIRDSDLTERHQIQDDIQHLRRASLPRLRNLRLAVNAITCVALLDHLKTPPTCALTYHAPELLQTAEVTEDVFMPLVSRLAKFARRFFKKNHPEHVALHREYGVLGIANMRGDDPVGFLVQLRRSDKLDFPVDAVKTFFSQFSLPRFPKATHLWLELSADTPSHLWRPFLERFPSVQVMLMSIRDIGYFKVFAEILLQTGVLPSLQVIKLRPGEHFDPIHLKRHEMEAIAIFKVMRMMTGRPVHIAYINQ